jgi:hypothetical protein
MVADMREISFISGNFGRSPDPCVHGRALSHAPRRLVEECAAVTTADLRRVIGRKTLLNAANDARPVKFQLEGQWFEIYVQTEPHHRKWRQTLDDNLVRIWISCPQCRHRARKLYTFPLGVGSPVLADLQCRRCYLQGSPQYVGSPD